MPPPRVGGQPLHPIYPLAICHTNTWGTMNDKLGVLSEDATPGSPASNPAAVSVCDGVSVGATRMVSPAGTCRIGGDRRLPRDRGRVSVGAFLAFRA